MIRLINAYTGGDMWVHESRVPEYLAAGHRLAADPPPTDIPAVPKPKERKKPKKKG